MKLLPSWTLVLVVVTRVVGKERNRLWSQPFRDFNSALLVIFPTWSEHAPGGASLSTSLYLYGVCLLSGASDAEELTPTLKRNSNKMGIAESCLVHLLKTRSRPAAIEVSTVSAVSPLRILEWACQMIRQWAWHSSLHGQSWGQIEMGKQIFRHQNALWEAPKNCDDKANASKRLAHWLWAS